MTTKLREHSNMAEAGAGRAGGVGSLHSSKTNNTRSYRHGYPTEKPASMRWTTLETRERPALSSYTSLSRLRNLLKLSEPPLATMFIPGDMAEVDLAS